MADDRIIRSIVEKCKFFYDDALLSDETIIEKYLSFFARQFDPAERSVSFAFHTGSLCFDVVSVALEAEFSEIGEILTDLACGKAEAFRKRRRGDPDAAGIIQLLHTAVVPGQPCDHRIGNALPFHMTPPFRLTLF